MKIKAPVTSRCWSTLLVFLVSGMPQHFFPDLVVPVGSHVY